MINSNDFLFLIQAVPNSINIPTHSFSSVQYACRSEVFKVAS